MSLRAVFAFDRENWCSVFRRMEAAEAGLEVNDVDTDEYVLFGDDGTVLAAAVEGRSVVVRATTRRDLQELRGRLERYCSMAEVEAPNDDPLAIGNAILAADWSRRWPRKPRWLDRRLHGHGPPRI